MKEREWGHDTRQHRIGPPRLPTPPPHTESKLGGEPAAAVMRKRLRLWLEHRFRAVHDAMAEHRDRLDNLRIAIETGTEGWAPAQVDLCALVEARATVDEAWAALRHAMGSLRAARALTDSQQRLRAGPVDVGGAHGHLVAAITGGQDVQRRLKRIDDRLRAMAFVYAGEASWPALAGTETAAVHQRLVGAVQAWGVMLQSLASVVQGLAPFPF